MHQQTETVEEPLEEDEAAKEEKEESDDEAAVEEEEEEKKPKTKKVSLAPQIYVRVCGRKASHKYRLKKLHSLKTLFLFCVYGWFACLYIYAPLCVWYSWRPEEGIGRPWS